MHRMVYKKMYSSIWKAKITLKSQKHIHLHEIYGLREISQPKQNKFCLARLPSYTNASKDKNHDQI